MHRFEIGPEAGTGNADIDVQLQTLFSMANEILFLPAPEPGSPAFRRAVSFLFSYLEYHFASEELIMLERGYPSRRFHAAFHDHVRREAGRIGAGLARSFSIEETRSAIFFLLEDWVVYHVAEADRQLATHLRDSAPAGVPPRLPGIRPLKACGAIAVNFDERILAGVAGKA
jgi:hemerythrin-like metal-binding protein